MAQVKVFSLGGLGSPCCCAGTPTRPCHPCSIPEADLTLSWSSSLYGAGSTTLFYTLGGTPTEWLSACLWIPPAPFGGPGGTKAYYIAKYGVSCIGSGIGSTFVFSIISYTTNVNVTPVCTTIATNPLCSSNDASHLIGIVSSTCSPFSMVLNPAIGGGASCTTSRGLNVGAMVYTLTG